MTQPIRIAPSILAADFTRLGQQIGEAEAAGADSIHVDIMDGRFVPNISMGPLVVEAARRATTLPLDVHLMIIEPDHMIPAFAAAGASVITVHWEACPHLHRTLQFIQAQGCRAGVAINPHTPVTMLTGLMHMVDLILVMTVNPGFGGQSFLAETLPKMRQAYQMIEAVGREIDLEVDGGITAETAVSCVRHGVNLLVAGSAVFSLRYSVAEGVQRLRQALANERAGLTGSSDASR